MAGEVGVDPRTMQWVSPRQGIARKLLRGDLGSEYTTLLKMDAGVRFPKHLHPKGEELFVVIQIEGQWYESGCYIYSPPGAVHDIFTDTGAVMLIRMPGPATILGGLSRRAGLLGTRDRSPRTRSARSPEANESRSPVSGSAIRG